MASAQTLADVAAAYLLNAQARDEARATSDYFRHTALHDVLTGLPNRLLLKQRVEHAAMRARRSHTNAAVLFVDLDRFKHVNDAHGHQVGDDLLLAVSGRLAGLVRPGDTLARFSGDEFVFLCEDLYDAADAESLAARIDESFRGPVRAERHRARRDGQCRHGVRRSRPGHHRAAAGRCRHRDVSGQAQGRRRPPGLRPARVAAHRGPGQHGEGPAVGVPVRTVSTSRISRSCDARTARSPGSRRCCAGRTPTGAGCRRCRWWRSRRRAGLISEIGGWILERSCRDRARWLQEHPAAELDLAVNVSARQLMSPAFCTDVESVLARTGMDRERADPGDDREHLHRGQRTRDGRAERSQGPGHPTRARRLRDRLLLAELSAAAADRHRQDRQGVHRRHRSCARGRGHRRGRHQPGARARAFGHRRGRGDAELSATRSSRWSASSRRASSTPGRCRPARSVPTSVARARIRSTCRRRATSPRPDGVDQPRRPSRCARRPESAVLRAAGAIQL